MNITEREENGVIVFSLEGRIDSTGAIELDNKLQGSVAEGNFNLVLDMSQVQYINSAALRTLADVITQTRAKDGDLKLAALTPKVKRVFQIVGFDRFSAIYDKVSDAVADF